MEDRGVEFMVEAAINAVARSYGISRREVIKNMQDAIDDGFFNPDPAIQAEWRRIPFKGFKPTPQELIAHIVRNETVY